MGFCHSADYHLPDFQPAGADVGCPVVVAGVSGEGGDEVEDGTEGGGWVAVGEDDAGIGVGGEDFGQGDAVVGRLQHPAAGGFALEHLQGDFVVAVAIVLGLAGIPFAVAGEVPKGLIEHGAAGLG